MISISPAAAAHIRRMLAKRDADETGLRIGVKAGGCSGFEYVFGWERMPRDTDAIFERRRRCQVIRRILEACVSSME